MGQISHAAGRRHHQAVRTPTLEERALALWPRLDRRSLRQCRHDPRRIAALVSRRTAMPLEAILGVLTARSVTDEEAASWFG